MMAPLARRYLKTINLWNAYEETDNPAIKASLSDRATRAAAFVETEFRRMLDAGELKHLSRSYREARRRCVASGKGYTTWARHALDHKKRMIDALVSAELHQAKRGIADAFNTLTKAMS